MEDRLLFKFLKNEASAKEVREVLDWLDESPANREYLNALDEADFALQIWQTKLRREGLEPAAPKRAPMSLRLRGAVRWASAVAAVLVMGLASGYLLTEYNLSRAPEVTFVSTNGQSTLHLMDGTRVWLTPGSSVSYPTRFGRKHRTVSLKGEAMFEVAPDAQCPFLVKTFACTARVLGTRFDIGADGGNNEFSAALLNGRLQVTHNETRGSVVMNPLEIVRLDNGLLVKDKLEDVDNYLWTEGIINLRGLKFEEIVRKLEANFHVRFVVERDRMPSVNFGWGKVAVSSGIEHALEVLRYGSDFEYDYDRNAGVVTIR